MERIVVRETTLGRIETVRYSSDRSVRADMRWHFGNPFTRLLWNGTKLRERESQLLALAVDELPADLRRIVDAQLHVFNLVQREVDGRALNFYRKRGRQADDMTGVELLPMKSPEAPLVKITVQFDDDAQPVHAVLTAVQNRVFCLSLSRSLPAQPGGRASLMHSVASWRSNVAVHEGQ